MRSANENATAGGTPMPPSGSNDHNHGDRPRTPPAVDIADDAGSRELAAAPVGAAEPAVSATRPKQEATALPHIIGDVTEARRESFLRRHAEQLRRFGASEPGLYSHLRRKNQVRCDPALDDAVVREIAAQVTAGVARDPDIRVRSLEQILSDPIGPRNFLVEAYVPADGGITVLFGPPGVGKSLLVQQIALALARGERGVVGRDLPGRPVQTLAVFGEHHPASVKGRLERQLAEDRPPSGLHFLDARDLDVFDAEDESSILEELIETLEPELVVLDSMTSLVSGDLADTQVAWRLMKALEALTKRHGVTFFIVGHARKSGGDGRQQDLMDSLRGARELSALIDVLLHLGRDKKSGARVLTHVKGRDSAAVLPLELTLDERQLRFFEAQPATNAAAPPAGEALAQFILRSPGEHGVDDLAAQLGVSADTIRRRSKSSEFKSRVDRGEIAVAAHSQRGEPKAWSAATLPTPSTHAGGINA